MPIRLIAPSPLHDARADAVLDRLYAAAKAQTGALLRHDLPRLPRLLLGGRIDWGAQAPFYRDKFIALERDQGELLYVLARARAARRIVAYGTSYGISTIFLAAAVRDNGGGLVVGSELEPAKVEAARRHLAEAGLAGHADVRAGDARETLRDPGGPVDFVLLDGWPSLALPILRLLEPHLAPGALVVADNAGGPFKRDMRPLIDHLGDAANGYRATVIGLKAGMAIAARLTPSRSEDVPPC